MLHQVKRHALRRLDPHPGKRRSAWIKTSRALVEDMGGRI